MVIIYTCFKYYVSKIIGRSVSGCTDMLVQTNPGANFFGLLYYLSIKLVKENLKIQTKFLKVKMRENKYL